MFRIDVPSASATRPIPANAGTPGYFYNGNPGLAVPATVLDQDFFNSVQEELMSLLTAAGVTPSKTTLSQVFHAIMAMKTFTDVGTVNALACNPPVPIIALYAGMDLIVVPANTTTGAATLNLSNLGAVPILRPDGTPTQGGDLVAGQAAHLNYRASSFYLFTVPTPAPVNGALDLYCNAVGGTDDDEHGYSAGAPFATLQYAVNYVQRKLRIGPETIKIKLNATGAFSQGLRVQGPIPGAATRTDFQILFGAGSSVAVTDAHAIEVFDAGPGLQVAGTCTLTSSGSASYGCALVAAGPTCLSLGGAITFGTCVNHHLYATQGGLITIDTANYDIDGGGATHFTTDVGGTIQNNMAPCTVTLAGTPAFTKAFANAFRGDHNLANMVFSGGASAGTVQYSATRNSVIDLNGAAPAGYFPGGTAGAVATGGIIV